jgi:hypothetical protein
MATNGTNISADVVQTAASWIESPAICITQLQCIIDQFDSLFSVQAYTTSHGEELLIAEETEIKTELPRWKRINELCKSIRVAEKALSLCEKKSPDVFKIDPQWQISFSNLRHQLIKRSVPLKVPRLKKSPATIDELAEASTSFVGIVNPLIDLLTLWTMTPKNRTGKNEETSPVAVSGTIKSDQDLSPVASDDYRSVNWYGKEFEFTPVQAAVVKILWVAWKSGRPLVSGETITANYGGDGERVRDVFKFKGKKMHPAWGSMIQKRQKNAFSLVPPTTPPEESHVAPT